MTAPFPPHAVGSPPEAVSPDALPLRLDDPSVLHVLAGGGADLFHAPADAARLPLGHLPVGAVLFGLPEGMLGPEEVIAVPMPRTRIWCLPEGVREDPMPALIRGAGLWAGALAQAAQALIVPHPRADLALVPGSFDGLPGQVVMAGRGTLWCDLPPSGGLLFGIEPVFGRIALPEGAWITLEAAGKVVGTDWDAGFTAPGWDEAMASFNAAMVELMPVLRGLSDADEHNRLTGRRAAEEVDRRQTADSFAGMLGNRLVPATDGADEDPLLQVMRSLARRAGTRIIRPTRASRAQMDRAFTLDEIARVSGLSLQRIRLAGRWWTQEAGDLLLTDRDGNPVAALWTGRRYVARPAGGAPFHITAATAAGFTPDAVQLFPELGPKPDFAGLMASNLIGSGRDLAGFLVAAMLGGVLGQVLPLATNAVFGLVVPAARRDQLLPLALIIAGIAFATFFVSLAAGVARQRSMSRLQYLGFRSIWDRISRFPAAWHKRNASADTVARATGATGAGVAAAGFGFTLAGALGLVLSSLWVIAWNSASAALLIAGLLLLHLAVGWLAAWAQMRAFGQGEAMAGTADSLMLQIVGGLSKLRSAAAEERVLLLWADRFAALRAHSVAARRVANLLEIWLSAFPLLASCALFLLLHGQVTASQGGGLSLAALMSVVSAFGAVILTAGGLLRGLLGLLMAKPGWNFGKPLLEAQPEARKGLTDPGPVEGRIEIANLSFAYPDQPPLVRDLSLKIRAGEMVAIVGRSGSGKTTLLHLLLGLEQPSSGAIYVDGHDLRGLDLTALRRQIGTVLQDERLPPGTIMDAVRGTSDAVEAQVWQALTRAAIADEIMAMPMRLHTMLTDAARTLSGGQIQRIALARAFLSEPPILLLDEATSALDGRAQAAVMGHVAQMRATRIVVAHRLSTIRAAHRILVLEGGRIVEEGSHEALMACEDGRFRALTRGQLIPDG